MFQEVEVSTIQGNHMRVVNLLGLNIGRLYSQEIFLVFSLLLESESTPGQLVQTEGLCQWKFPVAPESNPLPCSTAAPQPTALRCVLNLGEMRNVRPSLAVNCQGKESYEIIRSEDENIIYKYWVQVTKYWQYVTRHVLLHCYCS